MRKRVIWRSWIVLAATAAISAGCARDRGPIRADGFSRSSTLGSDLREVPRGVTVPPPSLGVDLVGRVKKGQDRDFETFRAGASVPTR